EPFLMISQSNVSRGSVISSRSSEIGRISSSANLRAVICQARCSLLRAKSMDLALGSFGRDHGRARRPAIARQLLGDALFLIAVARVGVQAEERIVHLLLHQQYLLPSNVHYTYR